MAPLLTRTEAIEALLDAEERLAVARDEQTTAVVRQFEGWDDPPNRVQEARHQARLAAGAASAVLDQALAKAGL